VTRCWFVDDHRADYPVKRLCELVELPRATFYRWANPTLSDRYVDDARLANEIVEVHQASRGTYGSPRVWGQLRRRGIRVGEKRVARLMAELGLAGAHSRKKWRRGATTAPAGDLLERDFTAEASDLRWVADITEFGCLDGKLFLAGIVDLHDRGIAGWSMGQRQTTDLVVNALVMALARRDPDSELIHHADKGSQYTAVEFTNRLADWKLQASYGSTGDCFDNAAMEAVWATIKREIRHLHGDWTRFTRSELRTILIDYIETFYNRARHQAGLEHHTPAETYAASRAA
jgi:transposase InsO family protein